jgi:hypothetical protein
MMRPAETKEGVMAIRCTLTLSACVAAMLAASAFTVPAGAEPKANPCANYCVQYPAGIARNRCLSVCMPHRTNRALAVRRGDARPTTAIRAKPPRR